MKRKLDPDEARQAEKRAMVRRVFVISTVLAAVALLTAYLLFALDTA